MEINQKIVGELSSLFNVDSEIVTKAITSEDGDGSFIESWKNKNVVKSKEDFETFQNNLKQETQNNYLLELKEKAKAKELPQELYSFFKGNVSEELERKLAKAAGVDDYSNYEDLVSKVIASKGNDETIKNQLKELQERNQQLADEKENALKEANSKFDSELINFDKKNVYGSIDLDYSDEAKPKQLSLLKSQVDANYNYIRKDGKTLVSDKDGNIVKNPNTLEPMTLSEVAMKVAKEYDFKIKSPESGGQGGSSSQGKSGAGVNWAEYAESQGVKIGTREADKLYLQWKENNK